MPYFLNLHKHLSASLNFVSQLFVPQGASLNVTRG